MADCTLPTVGSDTRVLVLVAFLIVGAGISLLLMVRRRGVGGAAAIAVTVALGATALVVGDARRADAATCPPATTVTGTAAPTSIAAPTTTTPGVTTTAAATTTTAATSTTTTTLAVPDLTPTIVGPLTGFSGQYVITITNAGDAPTTGPMTFTLALTVLNGPGPVLPDFVNSADWTSVADPAGLTFTSNAGLNIAPGSTSVVTLLLEWRVDAPGSWRGTVALPTGIGGETNGTNNSDSITVVIPPPP